ncbi:PhnA-like protein [Rhizobiaceae bacterium n13]|uniref:PhnA-like protein n=1 Tax=Ferirhizobium litorale TaxID=2927786 RepID=UPI0024B318ED|nr:PhnA-like protein [Fererhizobium litorale]MDI7865116.1 PhnA-like protein [Fererhizobium litorale]
MSTSQPSVSYPLEDARQSSPYPTANEGSIVYPELTGALNKISWGAVFAGVALALAAQFLLNLLGVGIGAAVLDPTTTDNPAASTFSIVGGLWFVVAGIIASFIGAYVASHLSGRPSPSTGGYHGITTWAVTTLVVLYLLTTSVGALVGGAFSGLSSVVGGVGRTAATVVTAAAPSIAAATDPMGDIERQIRDAGGGSDPQALQAAAVAAMRAVATGDQAQIDDAKTRAADALARAQNIPVEQARAKVDVYEADYKASVETAKQQALNAAQTTATVVSRGALLGFLALLLGVVAAWFGGVAGTKPAVIVEEYPHGKNV